MTSSSLGVDEQGPSEGSTAAEPAALSARMERAHAKQKPKRFSPGQSEGATEAACASDRPSPQTRSYGEASASTADPVASRTERRSGFWANFAMSSLVIIQVEHRSQRVWSKFETRRPRAFASLGVGAARMADAERVSPNSAALEYMRACSAVGNTSWPESAKGEGYQLAHHLNVPSVSFQKKA